jgi:hypothetical protein
MSDFPDDNLTKTPMLNTSKKTILDRWLLWDKQPLIDLIWPEREARIMPRLREANDIVGFLNSIEDYILTLENR